MDEPTEKDELCAAVELTRNAIEQLSIDVGTLTLDGAQKTILFCDVTLGELVRTIRPIVTRAPDQLMDQYSALRSIKNHCSVAFDELEAHGVDVEFLGELFTLLMQVFSKEVPEMLALITDLRINPDPGDSRLAPSIN